MKKRLAALCIALCLLWTVTPAKGLVSSAQVEDTAYYINPLYADVVTEADLRPANTAPALKAPALGSSAWEGKTYYTAVSELAPYVRSRLTARQGTIQFSYASIQDMTPHWDDFIRQTLDAAMAHTGVPTEGDYLLWQYAGASLHHVDKGLQEGLYRYDVTVTMTYYTTAAQEAEVDAFVEEFMAQPAVASATDYEKVCAIYDWLCDNVYYDWDNFNAQNDVWRQGGKALVYPLMYTAYGAAVDVKATASSLNGRDDLHGVHTAVCQGYGVLFYRLALECGLDARLIAGDGGGAHAWNVVELEGQRYLLDATWDAQKAPYQYFLRGSDHFPGHRPYVRETVGGYYYGDTYDYALLGVSGADYVPPVGDLDGDGEVTVIDLQALFAYLSGGGTTAYFARRDVLFAAACDYNGDGSVNILDYQALYEAIK